MSNKYDLIRLLKKYNVVIPIIQRDYAQGRKDKQFIRKSFLKDIKNCLDSGQSMSLDFIYGNEEDGKLYPLDGQQRLTTLWLVYWYLALKTNNLCNLKTELIKFSYETRESSKEFCTKLCSIEQKSLTDNEEKKESIVCYIKKQSWFYSVWLQDPTISAMLRSIGGDSDSEEKDNIEAVFKDENLNDYYKKLIDQDNPLITFELMVIGSARLPVSDDLYIKMNARGKELTDFENFKADLISWIKSTGESGFNNPSPDGKTTLREYYPAQIDNLWTDVFWNYSRGKDETKIDDIFFSFINRYVLNLICLAEGMVPTNYIEGNSKKKNDFNKLYGISKESNSGKDNHISYEGFDVYKDYFTLDVLKRLDALFTTIHDEKNQKIINNALSFRNVDEENAAYSFFPYIENGKLKTISQKERVYFLAITSFITNMSGIEEKKFTRWMRVAKNLIENAGIDSIPTMITCMRLINTLSFENSNNSFDIYKTLEQHKIDNPNTQLDYQLKEEHEKAIMILEDFKQVGNNDEDNKWEKSIINAEKYSFFNGTIRFLFHNEKGTLAWGLFKDKFDKSKELFEFGNKSAMTKTVNKFLQYFDNFDEIYDLHLFTTIGYDSRNNCWKRNILCNENLKEKVHQLLLGEAITEHDDCYEYFLNSGLIDIIVKKNDNHKYRLRNRYGELCIYSERSHREGVYVSSHRKEMCEKFNKYVESETVKIVDTNYNFYSKGYYWGFDIEFTYNDNIYKWSIEKENNGPVDKICLIKNGENINSKNWDVEIDLIEILKALEIK